METLNQSFLKPVFGLMFYQTADAHNPTCYSELHPFVGNKMGAGQPLTEETYDSLVTLLKKGKKKKKTVNTTSFSINSERSLLAFSQTNQVYDNLVWSIKSGVRQLFFGKDLNIPSGPAPHPTLIFRLVKRELYVYSTRDQVPSPESKLYIPPYFNLATNGLMCMGTTQMENKHSDLNEQMIAAENAFFNSFFTHAGGLYKELSYNIIEFWKEQIHSTQPFPMDRCLATQSKLNDIL